MKVLSLLQPWASLVTMGAKKIETRSWSSKHRGELLIHASMGKAGALLAGEMPFGKYITNFNALPFGAIIGKVVLEDILPIEVLDLSMSELNHLTLEERAFGDYSAGRYGWILTDAVAFDKPIPMRGHLHLWEYDGPL
jgi:activating signal cointegrator 1